MPDAIAVPAAAPLVLTEGNYLLVDEPPWSQVPGLLDETWFVETSERQRLAWLVARFVAYGWDPDVAHRRVTAGQRRRSTPGWWPPPATAPTTWSCSPDQVRAGRLGP